MPYDELVYIESLTPREQEVFALLVTKGYTDKQIAEILVISPYTVRNFLSDIRHKIGVNSRSEAIVWARNHNWPPPTDS